MVEGDIRALAQEAGPRAIKRLIALMDDDSPRIAVIACQAVLDRAYGKPGQSSELPDGSSLPSLIRIEFVGPREPKTVNANGHALEFIEP